MNYCFTGQGHTLICSVNKQRAGDFSPALFLLEWLSVRSIVVPAAVRAAVLQFLLRAAAPSPAQIENR